jgi:ATP-dependent helicase/nuclease subunit A
VGDPKQSIYRFRGAEPQVFQAAQQFISVALDGALLSCEHTRRNAQVVIDRVNEVMLEAAEHDRYPGFRPHTTDSTQQGQALSLPLIGRPEPPAPAQADGPVWRDSLLQPRWLPEEKQRDLEAAQAARWLAGQIGQLQLRCSDVMVLSRKRDSLQPMQLALQGLGVPAFIGEKIALMDCCEVQDLVALVDVLCSPRHDLSLARVLRSPLFGVDSAALVPLARAARRTGGSWLALLQQPALVPELGEPAAAPLADAGQVLARWQGWLGQLPPHDALQAIYDDGNVLARYAAAAPALQREAVLGHLRALLEVALGHEGGRYLSPYMLVRALKAGAIAAPATVPAEAVRLLTIHGAKGLEADTVLLLDTDAQPRASESMVVLLDWPAEQAAPQRMVFLQSESRPPACCIDLLAAEQQARQREELNALYVAMTRARRVLAVSAREPFRGGLGSWWKRLSPRMAALEPAGLVQAAPDPVQPTAPDASAVLLLPVLPHLDHKAEASADAAPLTAPARIGLAMHRLLQWGSVSPSHARLAAREFRLDAQQCEQAVRAVEAIFGGCAWLWQVEHLRWQGSEVELIHEGRLMRLDRLVQRRDGAWWVIDFKSHTRPGERADLVTQLQDYARAVRALHAGDPVHAAFVTAGGQLQEIEVETA